MKYIELFAGIGCSTVAWKKLGWKPLAFAEIEPFPSAVLAHHYPGVPNLGDMTKVDWSQYRGVADLVVGGSPCQAFSVAGLRNSLDDHRGNLTLEYVRAVKAIQPRYAVWENVPGVLSTKDNAFGCLLAALVGAPEAIAVDYGGRLRRAPKWPRAGLVSGPEGSAAWIIRDAQYHGVAQRRRRVLLVFCPGGGADPGEILFERPRLLGHPPARSEAGQGVAGQPQVGAGERSPWPADVAPCLETSWGKRSPGSQAQEWDSKKGGALHPSSLNVPQRQGRGGRIDGESETFVAHALRADGFDGSEDGTGRGTPLVPIAFNLRGREGGAQAEVTDVASPRAASGGSSRTYVGVRRLLPVECERLMGLPDGYTDVPFRGKRAKDGPRYRAIGNGMAVPCMEWIGRRIQEAEDRAKEQAA